ncbi:MAG: protein jag [Eubacterium sp.]|nr:protein jag [Eubacterium sp.]MDY5496691.1 RNA-binding cell elongation regulator Jag/EloR [Anaerobutyricum sp.]
MEVKEYKAKTVEDAITAATLDLGMSSDQLDWDVIDEGSRGFLGIFNGKPAVIRVTLKKSLLERTQEFCEELFSAMKVETKVDIDFKEEDNVMDIDLSGSDMGILIGKRGQTLDALQYLISLFVNRESDAYIRVKLDTENYRERRKVTLEKLAKKIAYTVKRTKKPVALEPMNPYERRVIHSALQNDKFVCTKSEGEEPYRKVVIMLKKDNK